MRTRLIAEKTIIERILVAAEICDKEEQNV